MYLCMKERREDLEVDEGLTFELDYYLEHGKHDYRFNNSVL